MAVLEGKTLGYRNHPQLTRFKQHGEPLTAINSYLYYVWQEAEQRKYRFDQSKLAAASFCAPLPLPVGQLAFEWGHLLGKLQGRDCERFLRAQNVVQPKQHPIFVLVSGEIAEWERLSKFRI